MKYLILLFISVIYIDIYAQTINDIDGDGINNLIDNCIFYANPDQTDEDADGVGNICDCRPLFAHVLEDRPVNAFIYAQPDTIINIGTKVTFTLITQSPNSYQWFKNGLLVGSNNLTYIDSNLIDGDSIFCILTTNIGCDTVLTNESSNTLKIKVNPLSTSIIDNKNNKIDIYPNPIYDNNFLNIKNCEFIDYIELLNLYGQKIYSWNNMINDKIDFNIISKGIYILKIHINDSIQTFTIVKK